MARQQRTLVKRDGEWRILSAGSFVGSSYGASRAAIESRLDGVGADLRAAKKLRDAVEDLELNTRISPRASSAHRHLGEAHASAGDIRRATESFERALAIDPTNAASNAALEAATAESTLRPARVSCRWA